MALRVAVIYGGRSGEHEISLRSAEAIIAALDPAKYEVHRILITREGRWEPRALSPEQGANPGIDVVFPVLHGTFGEDGTVQGLLELAGLPYVGAGVLASAVVNVGIRGGTITEVPAHPGEAFQLSINVPPDGRYTSYKLDLYSPQGAVEWSRTIPASGDGTLSIYIPGSDHEPGGLGVHGIAADGESVDLGRYPLELQNQK